MENGIFTPLAWKSDEEISLHKPSLSYIEESFSRLCKNRYALTAICLLCLLSLLSILGPFCSPYAYYEIHLTEVNLPPSSKFWFGTDELGRDIFTRLCLGARISLFIGVMAAILDLIVGVMMGSIAGILSGKIDELIMRVADIMHSIPYLLIVIMLMVIMGSGIYTILLALTITGWITMARMVRGQIMQLRALDFIQAARALGASRRRILFKHFIPNAIGPIIATMTLTIPTAIFAEAFLSFLGLGVQAPTASLGTMASDGLPAMRYFPWRLFFPAGFIGLTIFCFNLIGDGLRDAFDPRLR